jgi:hypothetical protein
MQRLHEPLHFASQSFAGQRGGSVKQNHPAGAGAPFVGDNLLYDIETLIAIMTTRDNILKGYGKWQAAASSYY